MPVIPPMIAWQQAGEPGFPFNGTFVNGREVLFNQPRKQKVAKFEKTVKVKTPDGMEHESIAAAQAHMKQLAAKIVGDATETDIRDAIAQAGADEDKAPAEIATLRDAIRDVYLAAWPRANTGKPRAKKAAE